MFIPFQEKAELNCQLKKVKTDASNLYGLVRTDDTRCATLPGQPRIGLASSNFYEQLKQEFCTPDLDILAPHLWLVATQSSSHISPLHEMVLKGRDIIITENPELHLVWTDNRIFIKPIPRYMLNHAFWATHLSPGKPGYPSNTQYETHSEALIRAALGFMRTYYHLIRHESDIHIAKKRQLLPFESDDINLERFYQFICGFSEVQDNEVSPRYSSYGTLRLSRLNFWAKLFLRRFQFYQVHRQYGEYFARCYAPFLFFFGILSVVLSAMQVGLQAPDANGNNKGLWSALQSVSFWFSVATLLCICAIGLVISFLLGFMLLRELAFAANDLVKRRREVTKTSSARANPS